MENTKDLKKNLVGGAWFEQIPNGWFIIKHHDAEILT